jgi:hypothetical protein
MDNYRHLIKTQVTGSETVAGAAVSSPLPVEHCPRIREAFLKEYLVCSEEKKA